MSKDFERIEVYECNACGGGLPPCEVNIPRDNQEKRIPEQCFFEFAPKADFKLVKTTPVLFDWDGGIEKQGENEVVQ